MDSPTERRRQNPSARGERNAGAKLSWAAVAEIRALKPTMTCRQLALKYGVSRQAISQAARGRSWSRP